MYILSLVILLQGTSPVSARAETVAPLQKCADQSKQPVRVGELVENQDLQSDDNKKKNYTFTVDVEGTRTPIKAVRISASIQPSAGTIVYLCGGPSACTAFRPRAFPKNYDVVTFDYLGLGQNTLAPATPKFLSLENQAAVAKKLSRALSLINT